MTDEPLKRIIQQALEEKALWSAVDRSQSQFLRVEYPFSHLILTDASKYEPVIEAMHRVKQELKSSLGGSLRFIVRSIWQIRNIEYVGSYYRDVNLTPSLAFKVDLKSGFREKVLTVAVTDSACELLQNQSGAADNDYTAQIKHRTEAVRSFIQVLLAGKGVSEAWDPLWQTEDLKITSDTLRWMQMRLLQHA